MPREHSSLDQRFTDSLEKLLSDIDGGLSGIGGDNSENTERHPLFSENSREALHRAGIVPDFDGRVDLKVADDAMSCTATFFPPQGNGKLIEVDDIYPLLDAKGVVTGVKWKEIEEYVFAANTDREQISGVIVAEGIRPHPAVPAQLVPEAALLDSRPGWKDDELQVDHRAFSNFVLVEEGDVLARLKPAEVGMPGTTVTGQEIKPVQHTVSNLTAGENTRFEDDRLVAACPGRFVVTDTKVFVTRVLEVMSDVGYETGHISFPGDVIIGGEVRDRFTIECDGSLFCNTTLDASEVRVGGDITVIGGIIGRKDGYVSAKGTVSVKFIENCYVEVGGDVRVKTGIVNSVVSTLGSLAMGERGTIIGGSITAQNGVQVTQIGSPSGSPAEITCGIDYTVRDKLIWIRDNSFKLAKKLRQVELQIKKKTDPRLSALKDRIREKIHALNKTAGDIVGSLDTNEDAVVSVSRSIYPGNVIEIGRATHVVSRTRGFVQFTLDKSGGTIKVSPYDPSQSSRS